MNRRDESTDWANLQPENWDKTTTVEGWGKYQRTAYRNPDGLIRFGPWVPIPPRSNA